LAESKLSPRHSLRSAGATTTPGGRQSKPIRALSLADAGWVTTVNVAWARQTTLLAGSVVIAGARVELATVLPGF